MPNFRYKARDQAGKLVEGVMESATEHDLADKLRKMGYIVTGVFPAAGGVSLEEILLGFNRISVEDTIFFNIQLSNMLDAGLPLLTCLNSISLQAENRQIKKVISDVGLKVETGLSLSEAMASHPGVFSRLTVSMVKAGEASGNLPIVLKRLADFGESEMDLRQRVSAALIYPAILTLASFAAVIFIVTSVIPKFAEIFDKFHVQLPLITRMLNSAGIALRDYWHLYVLAALAIALAARIYVNTGIGRLQFDQLKLSLPVIGPLMRKAAISRAGRTLATLFSSGVPILESLEILEGTIGNEILARVMATVREAVRGGSKISEPLKVSGEFPPDTIQMIAAGEETGNLDVMLNKVADLYDSAVAYSIKKLTAFLESAFLLIMGSVVAVIMASTLIPMFDLIKILRR
ncbi:MAG: type II secretion system F family protein [Candidatus Omnitrophica bacterium]|nr:type II secretion system F family protein [Candidatus Omnitrophota bacterium]MDD5737207.1 type II secretion system F family protein [Candidatus Omnitrophota bacterium]